MKTIFLSLLASTLVAQSAGTFTATGNMRTAHFGHTATLLPGGKVLIAGGGGRAEIFDPSTGTFALTGDMGTPQRIGHTATLLANGKVLIAGGLNTDGRSAELYDPSAGTFVPTGNMTAPRFDFTATLLNNGKVLIAGGFASNAGGRLTGAFAYAELYDPETGVFGRTGDMVEAHGYNRAVRLSNGKVFIVGSCLCTKDTSYSTEVYDPETGAFTATQAKSQNELDATATLLTNGSVLLAGGGSENSTTGFDNASLYDPVAGAISATGHMTVARFDHTATLLPDGKVLIAGSQRSGGDGGSALASAEIYDPATGAFSATGSMVSPRFGHTATLLPDGTVLLAGGNANGHGDPGARAEIYHPDVLLPSPVLLAVPGQVLGQAAIQHGETYQLVTADDPAVPGEIIVIYWTGLLNGSTIPPRVAIGGRTAPVLWFGSTPGFAGLNQVNVRVPSEVVPGPDVRVRLNWLDRPSNEVSIGVKTASPIVINGVVNGASYLAGAIAPGEIVVITGSGLGPGQLVSSLPGTDGRFGTQLSSTMVQINGTPAQLIYTSGSQVAAIVPDAILGGAAEITVTFRGQTSASFPIAVAPSAPGIFTVDSSGRGMQPPSIKMVL